MVRHEGQQLADDDQRRRERDREADREDWQIGGRDDVADLLAESKDYRDLEARIAGRFEPEPES